MSEKIIFIGWDGFDQRNEAYGDILDAKTVYIEKSYTSTFRKIISWFTKSIKTFSSIKKLKPQIVIVKNTHFVIATVVWLFRFVFKYKLVYDSHSCSFSNSLNYPQSIHKFLSQRADLYLVTNDENKQVIKSWGGNVQIIHFPPINYDNQIFGEFPTSDKFNLCYVNTYSSDEPYLEVIDAIKEMDNVHLYITGNTKKCKHSLTNLPNVTHTGFISREEYLGLLKNSDAIIVLTNRDNTMQKGGNEAVYLEKPIITSDFAFLRNYFSKGAVYVKSDKASIEKGINEMISDFETLKKDIKLLKTELYEQNIKSVHKIKELIEG